MSNETAAVPTHTYSLDLTFEPFDGGYRPFDAHYLLYAAEGVFHLEVGNMRWLLPPQRAAWIKAGVPIRIYARQAVKCNSILFAEAVTADPGFDCRVFTVSPLAREMIRHAMRWGKDRDPHDEVANRFFVTLDHVCRELSAEADLFWLPKADSAELQTALTHILDHLDHDLTLAGTARAALVSERTLTRRFSDELSMTWRQFLRRARLLRAMERLAETDDKIIEVAHSVGFASISAFNHAFRAFTAETPSAYRRRL